MKTKEIHTRIVQWVPLPPRSLKPYPATLLAKAYRRRTPRERKEERDMEHASAGPQIGELE